MGRYKRDKQFDENLCNNNSYYMQYYRRLFELGVSMFEWKNLPDTIDERFLEITLFTRGKALFFKDDEIGELVLPCSDMGKWDIYNIPTKRQAYASNGYNVTKTNKDSVIIYNNYIRTNSMLDTQVFAQRLASLDRTIDINTKAQRTPILIACPENMRLTAKNAYMQYDGGAPVIFSTDKFDSKMFDVLKTDAPYLSDKLYELKTQIWNEALTFLGINNMNIIKKERLITDEVQRNQGGVIASRYSRLEARRQACKKINEMFGTNIECNYREDYQLMTGDDVNNTYAQYGGEIGDNE